MNILKREENQFLKLVNILSSLWFTETLTHNIAATNVLEV